MSCPAWRVGVPAVAAYVLTDASELFANDMLYGEEIQAAQKAPNSTGWIDWSSGRRKQQL